MPIHYSKKVISSTDVEKIVALSENWIMDMKGKDIKPAKLSRTVSAFANSNGGEIYLGIAHFDDKDQYFWDGYKNEESFNEYATLLENILPSFESYVIEAFEHPVEHTYVFHIIIHKTIAIQEIIKEYQRQKTNQRSRKGGSARKPQQYHAEAEVII